MAQNDNTQRWISFAIIAFNVIVILCMIVFSFIRVGGMAGLYFSDFVLTLVLAILVGGGVFWASKRLNL
jgi:hypothetical protein